MFENIFIDINSCFDGCEDKCGKSNLNEVVCFFSRERERFVLLEMEERGNKHRLVKFYREIHNQLNVIDRHR